MKKTLQILVCIVATLCCSSVVVAQSASEYDRLAREAYKNGDYAKAKTMCDLYCVEGVIDGHPLEDKIDKCLEYKNEIEKAQAQDNHIDAYHFSKKIAEINADDKNNLDLIKQIAIDHPKFVAEYRSQPSIDKEYNHLGELNYKAKKYSTATGWFIKASEMGNSDAQCNLGICYLNGNGVDKKMFEAEQYFRKSAGQKNPKATYYLGVYESFKKNYSEAFSYFAQASKLGDSEATFMLGQFYYNGKIVGQDRPKALKLYTQAAQEGSAEAQFLLGRHYYEGLDVVKDENKAIQLWQLAAKQGHSEADRFLKNLGIK